MSATTSPKSLTWLITGSSSGLGLSLTRAIIQDGRHTVIATSRNPSRTPDLVSEVERAGGKWLQLDVNESEAPRRLIHQLESEGTKIDVLVNNAGFNIFAPVETTTEKEARDMFETMFFGPLRLIQSVIPHMRQRKSGTIVNISSGASLMGTPSMGVYAGAKAGLDGMTRVLAKEIEPFNIRTLTVVIGTFNTNFDHGSPSGSVKYPAEYQGTLVDHVIQAVSSGTFKPNGDKEKAARAIYEAIVGEGSGKGKLEEPFMILGHDMVPRTEVLRDHLQRGLDAFRDTAISCKLDS